MSGAKGIEATSPEGNLLGSKPSFNRKLGSAEEAYLEQYPDVRAAVTKGLFKSGLAHYFAHGRTEILLNIRKPFIVPPKLKMKEASFPQLDIDVKLTQPSLEPKDEFFEELYLELNPDVASAKRQGELASVFEHWLKHGRVELQDGKRPTIKFRTTSSNSDGNLAEPLPADYFNAFEYLYLYSDIRNATRGTAQGAWEHWQEHGQHEGRVLASRQLPKRETRLSLLSAKPFGINVYGPFAAHSGLGTAARAFAKAVKATGIPFALHTFDTSSGEIRPALHHVSRDPDYRVNLIMANADQVARLFAAYSPGQFDHSYNIAVWQWELSSFRPDWYYAFSGLDEIWTNSDFQVDAISSIAPVPVQKIHLPIDLPEKGCAKDRERFGIPAAAFVFLLIFDVGSSSARKNPFIAITAFKEIKRHFSEAHLVIKYHSDQFETGFVQRLSKLAYGLAGLTVLSSGLSGHEMDVLRSSCDCLISPHRSEGFGLNICEFLSLGKSVIATNYSGNLDFFDCEVGFPVDYDLIEIADNSGPYWKGYIWAEPRLDSLICQMTTVLSQPNEVARRAANAVLSMKTILGIEKVSHDIVQRLDSLELDYDLPKFLRLIGHGDEQLRKTCQSTKETVLPSTLKTGNLPTLSIVVPVYNVAAKFLEACIDSVLQQTYPFWELCISNDASTAVDTLAILDSFRGVSPRIKIVDSPCNLGIAGATNKAIHMATGEFVVFLDNDDLLVAGALEDVIDAVGRFPDFDVFYSDEEKIDEKGVVIDHYYKPDWSPEHLESVMYVLHMLIVRKSLLLQIGLLREDYDGAQDYDLMLRCSAVTQNIHHIPKALYQWRAIPGSAASVVDAKPRALENGHRALDDYAKRKYGQQARVEPGLVMGTFRLRRPLNSLPKVSLMILTGNGSVTLPGRGEVNVVENFVNSIMRTTDYPNYEIVLVDNGKLTPQQVECFMQLGVHVINLDMGKGFNYAEKANFAVRSATTEHVVLLNDDMEVIREDWLTSLMELSSDPGIGAVGARLLHFDGSIQHVGTVLGIHDSVAHVYHSFPSDFVGYNAFTHLIRNYSAVTAACIATRKSVVTQIGGFDTSYAIDFNDIDFCLRLREKGYRIAYTPYAELFHFEGATAKRSTQNPAELEQFKRRWKHEIEHDPYYNSNLTVSALDFSLRARDAGVPVI